MKVFYLIMKTQPFVAYRDMYVYFLNHFEKVTPLYKFVDA